MTEYINRRRFLGALAGAAAAAVAAPAWSGVQAQSKPRLLMKLPLSPGESIQGLWLFPDGRALMTQDPDGNKRQGVIRFSLLTPGGEVERNWDIPYGAHGQSLYVRSDGDGYQVFTDHQRYRGLSIMRLSGDLRSMAFVGDVAPVTAAGRGVGLQAFGVDPHRDVILCARKPKGRIEAQYYRFSDFVKGLATPVSGQISVPLGRGYRIGWLQGAGTWQGTGYLLLGNNKRSSPKRLLRLLPDGSYDSTELTAGRQKSLIYYEPEALYVQDGRLAFGVYDLLLHRLYTMPLH